MADHCIQSVSLLAGGRVMPRSLYFQQFVPGTQELLKFKPLRLTESGKKKKKPPSHVQLFVIPRTIACQAPLSMELSRQESWNGLPIPSPGESFQTGD